MPESLREQRLKAVLAGIESGTLLIGSRQPIGGTPVWVTPEITQEGFATGRLSAELAPGSASNRSWLTCDGLERLCAMLDSGCYEVRVPEHGALLVVASLIDAGREAEAVGVLQELEPWMDRLQFYPEPRDRAQSSALVQLLTVREVTALMEGKAARASSSAAEAFRRAVMELRPLYHELVSLFLDTVPAPDKLLAAASAPAGAPFPAEAEAWPCQRWADGWRERGAELAGRCAVAAGASKLNRRRAAKGSMAKLLAFLRRVLADGPTALAGRDVGMIRTILVDFARKYGGPPGSEGFAAVSPKFLAATRFGFAAAFAPALLARLRCLPDQDGGYISAQALGYEVVGGGADEPLTAPISAEEAAAIGQPAFVRAGDALPRGLARAVMKCFSAPLERLIELGVVSSLEMLCPFVPQLAAEAAPIADARHRRLYAQVYRAFRHGRRTLLLLNLEKQVRLSELPWARALDAFKGGRGEGAAREALLLLARVALERFPGEGVPNKLQQDLRALVEQAGAPKEHPLLEGLAADIFMNRFSPKFRAGALAAARFVRTEAGLYERFWGLGGVYDAVLEAGEAVDFDRLIADTVAGSRVADASRTSWIAANHQAIQWQQVVCAANMVTLLEGFGLRRALSGGDVRAMAVGCLREARRGAAQGAEGHWKGRLRSEAQTTASLLQGTLLLALLPAAEQAAVLEEAAAWAPAPPRFGEVIRELACLVRSA